MAKKAEPNERLDRYLSAFALALRARALECGRDPSPLDLIGWIASASRDLVNPDELADVFIYTCMLADRLDINLAQAARDRVSEIWQDSGTQHDPLADQYQDSIPASPRNPARAASAGVARQLPSPGTRKK